MSDVINVCVVAFTNELANVARELKVDMALVTEFKERVGDHGTIVPTLEGLQGEYNISNDVMGDLYHTTMHYAYPASLVKHEAMMNK